MNEEELLSRTQRAMEEFAAKPSSERFLQMRRSGLIDASGKPQAWRAFLAVIAVKKDSSGKVSYFRCRKPTLGLPGKAEIDVSRKNMVGYLREGQRIITAFFDAETNAISEGEELHLTSLETIRTDANALAEDNLGNLPTLNQVESWM